MLKALYNITNNNKRIVYTDCIKKMVQSEEYNSRYDLCSKCLCIWYHFKAD